jgi:DNA-binding XRE family transcriptional regulator
MIRNNLQKYRKFQGLKHSELSEKINVSVSTIRKIEKTYYYPRYLIRSKICNFFNVSQYQMFLEED